MNDPVRAHPLEERLDRVRIRDVELFELKYGLSGELSRRMRRTQR